MRLPAIVIALLAFTGAAHAYNPMSTPEDALAELKTMDCTAAPDECRYIAALEVLSFFHACPGEWARRGGQPLTEDEAAYMADAVTNWRVLDNPTLRAAVLAKDNPLKDYLNSATTQYIKNLPNDDLAVECSRIAAVKDQHPAEEMSNLLWLAKKANSTINKFLEPPAQEPNSAPQ